ncbi:MAG: ABC transporter permease [Firmicutes bacterium]|nr:ABC transporter permease [Bacillota bacterium]
MAAELPSGPKIPQRPAAKRENPALDNLLRFGKYFITRVISLSITLVIAVYLTVLVANMGGAVDQIREGQIRERIGLMALADPEIMRMPVEDRRAMEEELVRLEMSRYGLDRPFIVRSFGYLTRAMTLNLGRAEYLTSDSGSNQVKLIILERLPTTLLLMMSSFLLIFFISLYFALYLSRHYGSFMDRAVIALAPVSSGPAWFYGIFLIMFFAAVIGIMPFGGMVKAPPPTQWFRYALSVLHHMTLPVIAVFCSSLFIAVYSRRTFFLIYSTEDYVEMAKAKGLSPRAIERRYILRPTLPPIITQFALALIGQWQGAYILETVFNWPGLGLVMLEAINMYDTPVIVANSVIFGYLLAFTVFILDIIYAIIDPRVKVGSEEGRL